MTSKDELDLEDGTHVTMFERMRIRVVATFNPSRDSWGMKVFITAPGEREELVHSESDSAFLPEGKEDVFRRGTGHAFAVIGGRDV